MFPFHILLCLLFASCIVEPVIEVNLLKTVHTVSNVSIPWLSRQGGEELVVTGNFENLQNPVIQIDGHNCGNVKKINSTQFSCITPANTKIKNVNLNIIKFNKTISTYPLKYVGVLGQATTKSVIQKTRGVYLPVLVKKIDSKLFIGDYGNKRIVGFNNFTNINNRDFDFSLGRSHLNQDYNKVGMASGNYLARELDYKNGLFMFADGENNRVLIFDGIPTLNQKPKIILGQPDYESFVPNNGGLSAKSLYKPMYAKFIDGKIFVSDSLNNRILVWNSLPSANFQNADYVLGQPDFYTNTVNTGGISSTSFNFPLGIDKIGNKFFVADYENKRILIWNSVPTSNVGANQVMGQANLTSVSGVASANTFLGPVGFRLEDNKFFVLDSLANRILVYKNFDLNSADFSIINADIVLGQPDFTSTAVWEVSSKITAQSLNQPSKIEIFDGKLYVADTYNNRILIYNHIPDNTVSDQHQPADEVIGQEALTMSHSNRAMYDAKYLPRPSNISLHEGKLLINSESLGRVSVWNSIPENDFSPADFVLGQNGFTENDVLLNKGNTLPTASSLNVAYQMLSYDHKLIVSDNGNNRILVWNNLNGTNGQAADLVLGQSDFLSKSTAPVSEYSLSDPTGMDIVDDKLVVSDRGNNRLLIYNNVPSTSNAAADLVVGQSNFTNRDVYSSSAFPYSVNGKNFNAPFNSASWLGKYVVSDHQSGRVLLWDSFDDFKNGGEAVSVWGEDDLTSIDSINFLGKNRNYSFSTVRVIGDILYVMDPLSNRILEFKNLPIGLHLVPTGVIGQKDYLSSNYINENPFSAISLHGPVGMYSIENYIYIADYFNDRVLILPK